MPSLGEDLGASEQKLRARELERWASKAAATKRFVAGGVEESLTEASRMMAEGDWGTALPRHFVALWASCHERVYGASALGELRGVGWRAAVKAAAGMLRAEFGGDCDAMAAFVRWAWLREEGKERWCRERGYERRKRVGWREQFGAALLTEHRVELARKGKR